MFDHCEERKKHPFLSAVPVIDAIFRKILNAADAGSGTIVVEFGDGPKTGRLQLTPTVGCIIIVWLGDTATRTLEWIASDDTVKAATRLMSTGDVFIANNLKGDSINVSGKKNGPIITVQWHPENDDTQSSTENTGVSRCVCVWCFY